MLPLLLSLLLHFDFHHYCFGILIPIFYSFLFNIQVRKVLYTLGVELWPEPIIFNETNIQGGLFVETVNGFKVLTISAKIVSCFIGSSNAFSVYCYVNTKVKRFRNDNICLIGSSYASAWGWLE